MKVFNFQSALSGRTRRLLVGFRMSSLVALAAFLSTLTPQQSLAQEIKLCHPKRVLLTIDYSPLELPKPRTPPVGDVRLLFTISANGTPTGIIIAKSRSTWEQWDAAAMKVLANARFDAPRTACRQSMRFKFRLLTER